MSIRKTKGEKQNKPKGTKKKQKKIESPTIQEGNEIQPGSKLNRSKTKLKSKKDSRQSDVDKRLVLSYYVTKFVNMFTKNTIVAKDDTLSHVELQIEYDRVYTKNSVKKVWNIRALDTFVDVGILGSIRNDMKMIVPQAKTEIMIHTEPYHVSFYDKKIQDKYAYWVGVHNNLQKQLSEMDEVETLRDNYKKRTLEDKVSGLGSGAYNEVRLKNIKDMIASFQKLESNTNNMGTAVLASIFIECKCPDEDVLETYEERLLRLLQRHRMRVKPVQEDLKEYFLNYGMASLNKQKDIKYEPSIVLTDRDEADMIDYSQGRLGDPIFQIYIGTDIDNGSPIFLNFTRNQKAQVILVAAKTGYGKTYLCKTTSLFHKLNKHRVCIMDYKGNEWGVLGELYGYEKISFSTKNPSFVNKMKISLIGTEEDIKASYYTSLRGTVKDIVTLVNPNKDQFDDVETLAYEIVQGIFLKFLIEPGNINTYHLSHDINMADEIWKAVSNASTQAGMVERHGQILTLTLKRLEQYFSPIGGKRYLFENEITIDDILESEGIVFDLGMNRGEQHNLPAKELLLRMHNMIYLMDIYTTYNKTKGLFTVKYFEEIQRTLTDERFLSMYNSAVSGGRSDNVIVYLLVNTIESLLDSEHPDALAITENITTRLGGFMEPEPRKVFVERSGLQKHGDKLDRIYSDIRYNNCFVLAYDTGAYRDVATINTRIPPEVTASKYFKSREVEVPS